jgi:hypothetical protein
MRAALTQRLGKQGGEGVVDDDDVVGADGADEVLAAAHGLGAELALGVAELRRRRAGEHRLEALGEFAQVRVGGHLEHAAAQAASAAPLQRCAQPLRRCAPAGQR